MAWWTPQHLPGVNISQYQSHCLSPCNSVTSRRISPTYMNNAEYSRYTDTFDILVTQGKPKINLILTASDIQKFIFTSCRTFLLKKKKSPEVAFFFTVMVLHVWNNTMHLYSISHGIVFLSSQMGSVHYKFNLHRNSQPI